MFKPTRFVLSFLLFVFVSVSAFAQVDPSPSYMGSRTCQSCHQAEVETWQQSHHAKAWMMPDEDTVDGDFNNAILTHKNRTTRFFQTDEGYFIETSDIVDPPQKYKVVGVGGIAPLQQYLIETEPGRLQSLDVVWDQENGTWFHLYPDQALKPDDGFHWSGPYKNWNARCAECHSTGFSKNYSLRERRYKSSYAEIGVGCEACHGPGEAHIEWAEKQSQSAISPFPGLSERGFLLNFSQADPEMEIQQCAGCHSRREPFQDSSPLPGTPFHDSYRLALLREGLYHPDGQILDEVYVYGSFLQSKMYAEGVRCSDCHDPHSAELKATGNAICTQCHSPAGNSEFSSLSIKSYDDPAHHFHQPGSEGAQCVSCHMIERIYMGVDGRRDHSFRVPRPDLSLTIGTPNACNDCHQDQTPAWAAAELEARFPVSRHRTKHFGEMFAAAQSHSAGLKTELLEIASHSALPAIVRATAIDLLGREANSEVANSVAPFLKDADPLIRASAVVLQEHAPRELKAERIAKALEDPAKAVRIAAARQLLTMRRGDLPANASKSASKASREWQSSLAAKSDFPETHMALGGAALAMRNVAAATNAFSEVTELDPQLVQAWMMLAQLHWSQGNMSTTETTLQKGLAANPEDPNLLELKRRFLDQ